MFSFLLQDGYLGSYLAPPTHEAQAGGPSQEQLKSLIKAGRPHDALTALRAARPQPHQQQQQQPQQPAPSRGDELGKDGLSLLHVASAANAVDVLLELVNVRGSDVNVQSASGNTALHYAAVNGHHNLVDVLLRYGADPSLPNHNGEIPLDKCVPRSATALLLLQNKTELTDKMMSPTDVYHKKKQQLQRPVVPGNGHAASGSSSSSSLRDELVAVATETALAMSEELSYRGYCKNVFHWMAETPAPTDRLRSLFLSDPTLATCRTAGAALYSQYLNDGFTPLHAAAYYGHCDVISMLFEFPRVRAWVRDLQGKTPLHVAAERGKAKACILLRQRMRDESDGHVDPVGEDAPLDLSGRTPLGCYSKSDPRVSVEMRDALFQPGDRSILPRSPVPERTGCSPWRLGSAAAGADTSSAVTPGEPVPASASGGGGEHQFVYAFSEACGFKRQMEDQVVLRCPLDEAQFPSWSLFGVCDGHGGASCSKYLAQRFAPIALAEARSAVAGAAAEAAGGGGHLLHDQPGALRDVLVRACARVEQEMRESAVFRCEVLVSDDATGQPKRLTTLNSSGSTGIFCLATLNHLAVANVGDSRAVLAQFGSGAGAGGEAAAVSGGEGGVAAGAASSAQLLSPRPGEEAGAGAAPASAASAPVPHHLKAVALSRDHKLNDAAEQERVTKAGASLVQHDEGPLRLTLSDAKIVLHANIQPGNCPAMAVGRSFGDFIFKQNDRLPASEQAMTAVPDVDVFARSPSDAFVVLASDGVFDFMTNDEVVDFVGSRLGYTQFGAPRAGVTVEELAETCDRLVHHCLERGSSQQRTDNLCIVVVLLGGSSAALSAGASSEAGAGGAAAPSPAQTPRHQPVLTPSSGTAQSTPVAQTLTRVFEANTQLDTSADGEAIPVENISRQLTFN